MVNNVTNTNVSQSIDRIRAASRQYLLAMEEARACVKQVTTLGGQPWTDLYFLGASQEAIGRNFSGADIWAALQAFRDLTLDDGTKTPNNASAALYKVL